jgi:hypothetical protein
MGYESRIYVVEKKGRLIDEKKGYAQVIAMYDMCGFNGFGKVFEKETDCFIYSDDGNTRILKDCYGDSLKEASISDVIAHLEEHKATKEYYRRVNPLLNLLKGFELSDWENLTVLHYGY